MDTVSAWVQEHLSDIIIALAAAIALAGGMVWWWRPLKAWWWRRAVRRLPDYLRSRAERYVGASKIFDIDDRVKMRNELCRQMGEFVNRTGVSRRTLARSGHEGLVIALAGAITVAPRKGDDRLILLTDNSQLSGNAQHKILDALDALASELGLVSPVDYMRIKVWIDGIADKELKLPAKIAVLKQKLD